MRFSRQSAQALGQREEGACEVAAVHRRDVPGVEGGQAPGIVPIQEMSFPSIEPLQGRHCPLDPIHQLGGADEAEVVCGEGRQQAQPDVGGRGPVGQHQTGRFLDVVGGQAVILGAHERLEVPPRAARDEPQEQPVLPAEEQSSRNDRPAQPVRDERRRRP